MSVLYLCDVCGAAATGSPPRAAIHGAAAATAPSGWTIEHLCAECSEAIQGAVLEVLRTRSRSSARDVQGITVISIGR